MPSDRAADRPAPAGADLCHPAPRSGAGDPFQHEASGGRHGYFGGDHEGALRGGGRGRGLFLSDVAITASAALVFDVETVLFSCLGLLAKSVVVDGMIQNMNLCKCFTVICERRGAHLPLHYREPGPQRHRLPGARGRFLTSPSISCSPLCAPPRPTACGPISQGAASCFPDDLLQQRDRGEGLYGAVAAVPHWKKMIRGVRTV